MIKIASAWEDLIMRRPAGVDVAAMVLTFKWPANSINQAFTGKSILESLQQYSDQQQAARAKRHWRLIRTLCVEYNRAHRHDDSSYFLLQPKIQAKLQPSSVTFCMLPGCP